jgi:ABC-type transport system substrate-binding protein
VIVGYRALPYRAAMRTRRDLLRLSFIGGAGALLAACAPAAPQAASPTSPPTTAPAAPTSPAAPTTAAAAAAAKPAAGQTPAAQTAPAAASGGKVPGPPPGDNARRGGVLQVGMTAEPNSFDSVLAFNTEGYHMAFYLFSGLMRYDYNPQVPVPDLADGMPAITPDGLQYTFKLKPNLKFSNGAPVTSQDVKFSLERAVSPEWKSWGASYLFAVAGARDYNQGKADQVEGITAPDPQTVAFKLTRPDVTFLSVLALQPMFVTPADEVKRLGKDFARQPVGTGAFMLKSYDAANQKAVAVPNPNYIWKGLPYVDSLEWNWGLTDDVLVLKVQKGELDYSPRGLPATQFARVIDDPQFKDLLVPAKIPGTRWLSFNVSKPPFDRVEVRRAIGMAIDKDKQVKLQRGTATQVNGIFPSSSAAYDPGFKGFAFDPAQARSVLAPLNLSFELTTSDQSFYTTAAEAIQQDLSAVGVNLEIDVKPAAAALDTIQKGDAPAFLTGWIQTVIDPGDIVGNIHASSGGSNYGKINLPDVDRLVEQAAADTDQTRRVQTYRQLEQILIDQQAVQVPLFEPTQTFLLSRRLKNFVFEPSTGPWVDRMWLES